MKKLLLTALFCASSAYAGLTGTQTKQLIAFADQSGFSFTGSQDIHQLQKGVAIITRVLVFYRATDGDYACVDSEGTPSLQSAYDEFLGSKIMWELTHPASSNSNKTGTDY